MSSKSHIPEPHRTVSTEVPWVSLTYLFSDQEAALFGSVVTLACHRCGSTLTSSCPDDLMDEDHYSQVRKSFENAHHGCVVKVWEKN